MSYDVKSYDKNSRLTSLTDDNGNTTLYAYYETNAQRYEEYPDGSRKTNYYNNVGLLISYTDPNGTIVSLDYDNAGRLTNKLVTRASGIEGTTFENFRYDGLGRITLAEDDDSIVERWYNSYSQVIAEHQTVETGLQPVSTQIVKNDYNIEGFRANLTYPNGRVVIYNSDEFNRINTISENDEEIVDYNYVGASRARQRIYQPDSGNPITLDIGYNSNRWAQSYVYNGVKTWQATEIDKKGKPKKYDWTLATVGFVYDFDKEGNKEYEKFVHESGKGDLFRYDNVYRLTGVKYGVQNPENYVGNFDGAPYVDREIFNMDNVGNRTSVTNGTTTNYTTNNLNQYTAINATNPTYDLNGNMTNDGYNSSIVYDYTNHPVRFDNVDYTVDMRYDALGRRIEKKSTAKAIGEVTIENYILDGARVVSDADSSGAVYKDYIWGNGIDELLATAKGRSKKYDFYLNNSLGSITHIANNKAEVQESYKYKVNGTVTMFDKKGEIANKSKEKNRYMFTGREYEPEIKLYYYRARYYLVAIGRFIARDPINYEDNMNIYTYVSNNPSNAIDSMGEFGKIKEFVNCGDPVLWPNGKTERENVQRGVIMACVKISFAKDFLTNYDALKDKYLKAPNVRKVFDIDATRQQILSVLKKSCEKCEADDMIIQCMPGELEDYGDRQAYVYSGVFSYGNLHIVEEAFEGRAIEALASTLAYEISHYGGSPQKPDFAPLEKDYETIIDVLSSAYSEYLKSFNTERRQ